MQRIIPTSLGAAAAPGALVGLAHLGTWAVPQARHRLRPVRPELVPTRPIRLPRPLSPRQPLPDIVHRRPSVLGDRAAEEAMT